MSPTTRARIIEMRQQNLSYHHICQEVGRSKTACIYAYKLFEETGQYKDRLKSGRPRKTDDRQDRVLKRLSERDRKKSSREISIKLVAKHNIRLALCTVCLRLNQQGLFGRVARKKLLVSVTNRQRRLQFARAHLHWTADDWRRVTFSDEKKFNHIGSDGRVYVRCRRGEAFAPQCLRPTINGGGSVMIWGFFSRNGPGPVHRIQGIKDGLMYKDILRDVLLPHSEDHLPLNWIFQQDNDPKHQSRLIQQWLANNHIQVLDWPSQSPDLNPIKHLWSIVQKDVQKQQPRNLNDLFRAISYSWSRISPTVRAKLVDSMPRRCAAVIKNLSHRRVIELSHCCLQLLGTSHLLILRLLKFKFIGLRHLASVKMKRNHVIRGTWL
uniref:Transposase n=1 Tax=Plectus sambesii TaxID=2011161 RepID=A0A914X8X8_9BILA